MMRQGKNREIQQKFIERTGKTDQQITYKKSKICQKNGRQYKKTKAKRKQNEINIREEKNIKKKKQKS